MSIDRDVIEIAKKDAKLRKVSLSREVSDALRKMYLSSGHAISDESIAMSPEERGRKGGIASGVAKRAQNQNGKYEESGETNVVS